MVLMAEEITFINYKFFIKKMGSEKFKTILRDQLIGYLMSSSDITQKTLAFNLLGKFYLLYPATFGDLSPEMLGAISNPYKRLCYLTGERIEGQEIIAKTNFDLTINDQKHFDLLYTDEYCLTIFTKDGSTLDYLLKENSIWEVSRRSHGHSYYDSETYDFEELLRDKFFYELGGFFQFWIHFLEK